MKKVKLAIGSPVYDEIYCYSKKCMKKVKRDECRKYWILRLTVRSYEQRVAESLLKRLISEFAALTGSTQVVDLADASWGESSVYNNEKSLFNAGIAIPKDFDNMAIQKEFIRNKCKDYEEKLNNTYSLIC